METQREMRTDRNADQQTQMRREADIRRYTILLTEAVSRVAREIRLFT